MRRKRTKVNVKYVDEFTGGIVAVRKMPAKEVSESIALGMILRVGHDEWRVSEGPSDVRVGFTGSKSLKVPLQLVEPAETAAGFFYSSPTRWIDLPELGTERATGDEFVVLEDEWRQIEFVSKERAAEVDEILAQIHRTQERSSSPLGWKDQYLLKEPQKPIEAGLRLDQVLNLLQPNFLWDGVAYPGAPKRLEGGFAGVLDEGLPVYGLALGGEIRVLALDSLPDAPPSRESLKRLRALAGLMDLELVHWSEAVRVSPEDSRFGELLTPIHGR